MYYGSLTALSSSWHLCDGTNGTPDLRGVMVVGAGGTYSPNSTGGMEEHTHTYSATGSGGGHLHSYNFATSFAAGYSATTISPALIAANHNHYASGNTSPVAAHTHTAAGMGVTNSLPPYKAIYFIMRIQ